MTENAIETRAATIALANFMAALTVGLVKNGVISEADVSEYAKTAVATSRGAETEARAFFGMMFRNLKLD